MDHDTSQLSDSDGPENPAADAELVLQQLAGALFSISATEQVQFGMGVDTDNPTGAHEPRGFSESMYRTLVEQLPVVTFVAKFGEEFNDIYVSPQIEALLGFTQKEWLENPILWYERLHPDDKDRWDVEFARTLTLDEEFRSIYRFVARDGHVVWVRGEVKIVRDEWGRPLYVQGVGFDITELKRVEEDLRRAEEKYRNIFENAAEGIFQTTVDGQYLSANPALIRIYGYDSVEELTADITNISNQLYVDPKRRTEFVRLLQTNDRVMDFESQIHRKDGAIVWVSENARVVRDGNNAFLYYEGTAADITQRKAAEQQLVHNAFHDRLTGLANRALFMDRLTHLIDRTGRRRSHVYAVFFLDIDRFKIINDRLGHSAGDRLLLAVSQRLLRCVRACDTVARLGGDEFAILLEDIRNMDEAISVAGRIGTELAAPFEMEGEAIFTSASIGIALRPEGASSADSMLRDADIAMYQAKARGRAGHEVFVPQMQEGVRARLQLEADLRWAVERREFQLHYQPIVNLLTGRLAGFEALLRWKHPIRGWVSPAEFIPLAEETGFILAIGEWVIAEACRQLQRWQEQFPELSPLQISVNVSGRQFSNPNLIEQIRNALTETGSDPTCLKLEITESSIMENSDAATEMLQQAQDLGISKSLDDFGTGYSSLSYLHRLPIDTLKIDRSFVSPIGFPGENLEIVRTIINLAHNLGKDVVAEGIETEQQWTELRTMGCEYGQGFYFSRAVDGEAASRLIRESHHW